MLHPLIRALILVSTCKSVIFLLYFQDSPKNVRYPPVANIFIYFFTNNRFELGVGLFNSSFKAIYVRMKSKLFLLLI